MEKSTNIIRVIAAVVDERQLTLYKENGETIIIPQGDPRLAIVVKTITPVLAQGHGAVAEIDIGNGESENPYRDFEQMFGQAIQFFRVDKAKLAGWLGKAAQLVTEVIAEVARPETPAIVLPMALGQVPAPTYLNPGHSIFAERTPIHQPLVVDAPIDYQFSKADKLLKVADEIIAHAKASHHPEFSDEDTGKEGHSTIVAVMGDKVIGSVEKLKPQITRALKNSSAVGFSTFMARLAVIADNRRHSIEDLLTFLEKGDLPIANDGSFIIYKILRWKDRKAGTYVDCHTQKVVQRVGSYVQMASELVDHNRSVECSNGLHVARRNFLGNFPGDVVVLAKVQPEDVIAVPIHDANKMRVCGYHILFELPDEAFQKLRSNRPFTDTEEARILLGKAIAGDHQPPSETVQITESNGGGIITTAIKSSTTPQVTIEVIPTEALVDSKVTDLNAPKVDPKAVVTQVNEYKAIAESRRDKAQRMFKMYQNATIEAEKAVALQTLLEFKRVSKLGWAALGFSEGDIQAILS